MKIIVNDIAADKNSGGAFTILQEFYQSIRQYGNEHEWILLLADNYFEETDNIKILAFPEIKKSWIKRLLFDFFTGKKIIEDHQADLYFSLQNTALYTESVRQVVYLHQPLPYQEEKKFSLLKKEERKLAVYQKFIGKIFNITLKKADMIIVQTNWMKKAVSSDLKKDIKIEVIPPNLAIKPELMNQASPEKNSFFYPAADYIYKNHQLLFQAAKILNSRGIKDYQIQCTLPSEKKETFGTIEQIEFVGSLSLDDVYENYLNKVLVFPSYIETFGLPLLEAKILGTTIIAADTLFSREILKDYDSAYFFNYRDAEELANLLEQSIQGQLSQHTTKKLNNKNTIMKTKNSWEEIIQILTKNL